MKDWSESDLLEFPNLQSSLDRERVRHKERYEVLRRESKEKTRRDVDKIIKRIDVEMNLERIMQADPRYIGLGRRDKASISSYFNRVVMNRILHDARLLMRYGDDAEFQAKFNKRLADTIGSYFPERGKMCERYIKHEFKFERNLVDRAADIGDQDVDIDEELVEREKQKHREQMKRFLPPIVHQTSKEIVEERDTSVDTEPEIMGSISTLKPRHQIAHKESLRLPKI